MSLNRYGADLEDVHVHAFPSADLVVRGTSAAATQVEGYVTVAGGRRRLQDTGGAAAFTIARAESIAAALTSLFAECQRDPSLSDEVLGAAVRPPRLQPRLQPWACHAATRRLRAPTCSPGCDLRLQAATLCLQVLRVLVTPSVLQVPMFSPPPAPPSPSPPPPRSPLPPPRPPSPPSVKAVVLTLTASGAVTDYADTSGLQQVFATAAGVDPSAVTITVAAASVIITATFAVPASRIAAVRDALQEGLGGSAAAATAVLGISVESMPTVKVVDAPTRRQSGRAPPPPQGILGTDDAATAQQSLSPVMQAGIALLFAAVAILVGVCVATRLKRRRWFSRGRSVYVRSDSANQMHASGTRNAIKRSSSGLAHMDVEVAMDGGGKGGVREYADNFSSISPLACSGSPAAGSPEADDERRAAKVVERMQRARSLKKPMNGSLPPMPLVDLPVEVGGGTLLTGSAESSPRPTAEMALRSTAAAQTAHTAVRLYEEAAPHHRAAAVLQVAPRGTNDANGANGAGEVNLLHDEWMASLATPPAQARGAARAQGGNQGDDDDPFESAGHLRL